MARPNTRASFKEYCLRSLGKPVIDINVDEDQIEDRIDEAVQYFSQYHTDGVERMYLKYKVTAEDKVRLRKNKDLTPEEDAAYLTYFSIMLRSRENQHYQYSIGMIDASEWDNYLKSFKTLFKSEYHVKLWGFMKDTFNDEFVEIVDGIINENN